MVETYDTLEEKERDPDASEPAGEANIQIEYSCDKLYRPSTV